MKFMVECPVLSDVDGGAWLDPDNIAAVARPYPTLWLGGNAKVVLDRVARWGDGWAPLLTGGSTLARTTRTALIEDEDKLVKLIRDLAKRLEANGRALSDIDILASSMTGGYTPGSPDQYLAKLSELAGVGVTWTAGYAPRTSVSAALEGLQQFGEEVIARAR